MSAPSEELRVTTIQSQLVWENIHANLSTFEHQLKDLSGLTDLIVLPEMFSTGFSMNTALAETMDGSAIRWMLDMAVELNCCITGSLMIKEEEKVFNRMVFVHRSGTIEQYDKRHLFRMANEQLHYTAGNHKTIVNCKGWKINLQVCYDLRFPVWSRNAYEIDKKGGVNAAYDLMIYVANWPAARTMAWTTLLKARAIENQSYVVGVNRTGTDGLGIAYDGFSAVIGPKGEAIFELPSGQDEMKTAVLSYESLAHFREKFPVGRDADSIT
jgi:omega-amidase